MDGTMEDDWINGEIIEDCIDRKMEKVWIDGMME